ncbi:MAG: GH3 family domain-containing protein [Candidatus Helarchaeota archaeon]
MGIIRVIATRISKALDRYIKRPFRDPIKTQIELFRKLIHLNQSTLFGKRHNFSRITSIQQFQRNCPISTYEDFKPYIKLILEGKADILTKAKQVYWGQTSGTAGTPKLIPIVVDTFRVVNYSATAIMLAYIAESPRRNAEVLDGKSCHFGAYPLLRYEGGLPVGYGTGLFSNPYGGWQLWKYVMRSRIYNPYHLYRIKNLERRYYQLAKELIPKDIRIFSGVPSIIVNNFEKVLEYCPKLGVKAQKIGDLFPKYQLTLCGGISPKFYERKLEQLVGHKVDYREQLSATEGVIGIQLQEIPELTPVVNGNFFEFLPLKDPEDRCIISEIKKHEKYYVCISSFNGLYAYNIGDIIKFVSEDPPRFIFTARQGVVNLVDEKISQDEILYAINHTNEKLGTILTDFSVIGMRTPEPHYHLIVEFVKNHSPTSFSKYLHTFDTFLMEANDVYRYFRKDIGILKAPQLWVLYEGSYSNLIQERTPREGAQFQSKIPHLTDDPKVREWFSDRVKNELKDD